MKSKTKQQKWALITGATSGIGQATAELLAYNNFNLILCGRRKDRLEQLAKSFKKQNLEIEIVIADFDIQKRTAVEAFIKKNKSYIQNIDVLVNNAGLAKGIAKIQDANVDDWEVMIDTNIKGILYLTHAVLPFMIKNKSGHIVNLGSISSRWVYSGGAVYCATKFAVRALTEGLRQDLLGTDIRVSNISPGMVNTEFSLVRFGDQKKADAVYAGMKPLTAEDIAETIFWVVSRPQHVNVQELVVYPTDQAHVGLVHRRP